MTLDKAILHAEEVAKEQEKDAKYYKTSRGDEKRSMSCKKCAEEHRQLAEWLKELKELREQTRWTSATKKPPKKNGAYLVTIENCIGKHIEVLDYANDLYKIDRFDFHDKKGVPGWFYFDDEYGLIEVENVIGWRPLPQTYTESEVQE